MLPDGYVMSADPSTIDWPRVHGWLTASYWSAGISLEQVKRAAANSSLVVGTYFDDRQIGYLRLVSDRATFAWVCDVYVDEGHRRKGIAKEMVRFALRDAEHQNLRRWLLATKDAHPIYAACGFQPLSLPERWMAFIPPRD